MKSQLYLVVGLAFFAYFIVQAVDRSKFRKCSDTLFCSEFRQKRADNKEVTLAYCIYIEILLIIKLVVISMNSILNLSCIHLQEI